MCRMNNYKRLIPHIFSFALFGLALGMLFAPDQAWACLDPNAGCLMYGDGGGGGGGGGFLGGIADFLDGALNFIIGFALSLLSGSCMGQPSIGQMICNIIASATWVPGLITAVAYLTGLIFGIQGIFKLKEHVLTPDRAPISDALKRFLAGGCLFALPIVTEALYNTIVGAGGAYSTHVYSGFNGSTSGYGLDAALVALMKDIWWPIHDLMGGFAYLAGLIFTVVGITRLVKSSQEGAKGPGGFGTIMTFATAGVLFSLDYVMGVFSFSTFGDTMTSTAPFMMYTDGMSASEVNHVHAVISAVIGFVAIVGWISFIRGWFIIRGVAEGNQQASLMAGVTHIFGGALAVNLGPLLNAVQYTLGLSGFGVQFL